MQSAKKLMTKEVKGSIFPSQKLLSSSDFHSYEVRQFIQGVNLEKSNVPTLHY